MKQKKSIKKPKHKTRYQSDQNFAVAVKEASLKKYRKKQGKDFELAGVTVLRSLEFVDEYTQLVAVHNHATKDIKIMPVVRLVTLAKLLNTSYQTIWRWTSETSQLPEPILSERSQGRERPVYHEAEVRVIIRIIGEHLNKYRYYRKDHSETRNKLASEIKELRSTNYGETKHGNGKSARKNPGKVGKRK